MNETITCTRSTVFSAPIANRPPRPAFAAPQLTDPWNSTQNALAFFLFDVRWPGVALGGRFYFQFLTTRIAYDKWKHIIMFNGQKSAAMKNQKER